MISKLLGPRRSAEVIIEQPISVVWEAVTDTGEFHNIIRGNSYWGSLDRNTARAGMSFKKGNLPNPGEEALKWDYYVVNWDPPRHFSIGDTPKSWTHDFLLTELGAKTRLRYTRRFNLLGWLPFFQGFVDEAVKALNDKSRRK